MAEPGDPTRPEDADPARASQDHDDLVGFASPRSLAGRERLTADVVDDPAPSSELEPEPESEPEPKFEDEPELFVSPVVAESEDVPEPVRASAPTPAWARETPPPAPRSFGRAGERDAAPEAGLGLYAVYALILFAVPTLGVSALIGLLAVTGTPTPQEPFARSHYIFQQRTLWAAAVVALLGVILVVVNLGVFVLFLLALWVIVRGAFGVLTLKAAKPIRNPRHWLF